jgi:hypothetical protein
MEQELTESQLDAITSVLEIYGSDYSLRDQLPVKIGEVIQIISEGF